MTTYKLDTIYFPIFMNKNKDQPNNVLIFFYYLMTCDGSAGGIIVFTSDQEIDALCLNSSRVR